MEIKYLDKYSLANIIANKINYEIENERRIENNLIYFLIYDKNKFLKFDKNIYYLIKHYYI